MTCKIIVLHCIALYCVVILVSLLCTANLSFPHIMDWPPPTGHPLYYKFGFSSAQVNPDAAPWLKEIGKQLHSYIQTQLYWYNE